MPKAYTQAGVIRLLRAAIRKAGGIEALAKEWKLPGADLEAVLGGHEPPVPLLKRLGVKPVQVYVRE